MLKLLASVTLLVLSQMLLLTGHGMQLALLPLRAELEGFSLTQIGFTATAYFAGFTLGCLATPAIARRAGHIRTFAVLASLASAFVLVFPLWTSFWGWLLLRFGAGWCIAGLYALMESWLNEKASNTNRGMVMAFYTLINMAMIMVGQFLINVAAVDGVVLFAVASILFSVALVPVALSADAPAPIRSARVRLGALWQTSHIAVTGSFLAGTATGAFWGMGPVYASAAGFSTFQVTLFTAAAVAGGALSQLPLGRLSDHLDRRVVLLGATVLAALVTIPLALNPDMGVGAIIGLTFAFGAFVMPLYALAVAHANDRAEAEDFTVIGAGVLMVFGLGSAIGAPLAGLAMDTPLGSGGLFACIGAALALLVVGIAWRRRVRSEPVQQEQEQPFVAVTDFTPLNLDLDPRTEADQDAQPEEPEEPSAAA